MKSYETVACETPAPHVLVVTLNRPQAANALNTQMGLDVLDLFRGLILDVGDLRCIVLTGAGERFCGGGDLKERDGMFDADWLRQHAIFEQAFYALMDCPIPVIAAVNGAAFGGGCEFTLACDFIYADETATFAFPETGLGIIPGVGGTQNLPRAVGGRRARELLFTGQVFTAAQAHDWGMVNRVTPAGHVLAEALQTAGKIAARGPIAIRQAKRSAVTGADQDLKAALAIEVECYNRAALSADRREGVAAYNEKRRPDFKGV
jgi:enoyl-CoA hydratase